MPNGNRNRVHAATARRTQNGGTLRSKFPKSATAGRRFPIKMAATPDLDPKWRLGRGLVDIATTAATLMGIAIARPRAPRYLSYTCTCTTLSPLKFSSRLQTKHHSHILPPKTTTSTTKMAPSQSLQITLAHRPTSGIIPNHTFAPVTVPACRGLLPRARPPPPRNPLPLPRPRHARLDRGQALVPPRSNSAP